MSETQLSLPLSTAHRLQSDQARLSDLLAQDLDFHNQNSSYATHNFHSFPAKFPPQLPRHFIESLTNPGDVVLDPMQGSGTTVVEALLTGRQAIGTDIDPLALLITSVKTTPLDPIHVLQVSQNIHRQASAAYEDRTKTLLQAFDAHWDQRTREFIDNWFDTDTQLALMALLIEIDKILDPSTHDINKISASPRPWRLCVEDCSRTDESLYKHEF